MVGFGGRTEENMKDNGIEVSNMESEFIGIQKVRLLKVNGIMARELGGYNDFNGNITIILCEL